MTGECNLELYVILVNLNSYVVMANARDCFKNIVLYLFWSILKIIHISLVSILVFYLDAH